MALRDLLLRRHRALFVLGCLLSLVAAWIVLFRADLSPSVEGDFFFATDDPQLQESQRIGEIFPAGEQLLISVTSPDRLSDETLERVRALSNELAALPGVASVQSLTHGPSVPEAVPESPLWSRLLLGNRASSSTVLVFLEDDADAGNQERIRAVEEVLERHHAPSFALAMSGVPYVVEQIRRALARDLRVFSLSALLVFGLVIALVYRSLPVVLGTLLTCLGACAVTLALLHLLHKPIGLLTANLVTIVFVLTLSHLVFLTANHRREATGDGEGVRRAVRLTFAASGWCALTTGLGFGSLLFASAQPLRELGFAGALGTLVALALAYSVYPTVLHLVAGSETADDAASAEKTGDDLPPFLRRRQGLAAGLLLGLAAASALGLWRLDTDPHLLSYFAEGSELRRGLERIDRDGGSSPLLFVVSMPEDDELPERLDTAEAQKRMARLQADLEKDPAVGTALSLPVLLDEARQVPLAVFLPHDRLVDILESERFDRVARSFVDEERTRGLYFLRIFETQTDDGARQASRREVISRLAQRVEDAGLELEMKGGLYELQAALGELVAASLARGLGGLLLLFVFIAWAVSRQVATTAAMIVSLAAVPLLVLGAFGFLGLPLDIISSPAANVAIALGIDSMIHLVSAVRRERRNGAEGPEAWAAARARLWPAVAGATAILAAGFALFGLSSFPPTARFGLAIAGGTVAAAAMALVTLPWLARRFGG